MAVDNHNPVVPVTGISLYTDILQQTALNKKKLPPLTKVLRNNNVTLQK